MYKLRKKEKNPEVVNWEAQNSKYVLFLHSEASHPLPLNPIETNFASN